MMAGNKKPSKKYVPRQIVGGVAIIEVNRKLDGTYTNRDAYIETYRKNLTRIMNDVAKGSVSEEDLERMHNFHQFALAAMQRMPMADIDKAWRNAEAMSFLHKDGEITEGFEVHLDPAKQAGS